LEPSIDVESIFVKNFFDQIMFSPCDFMIIHQYCVME